MSWAQKLTETYNNCSSEVGVLYRDKAPLLPIYHSSQQAHIEAMIDSAGNFIYGRSRAITEKGDAFTIIPCTENSAWVANGRDPHPLYDKLKYIAGDYNAYTGKKDEFENYIVSLSNWCNSPFGHPKVRAILKYLQKKTLISDLIQDGVLFKDQQNMLCEKSVKDEAPPIFKAVANQQDAFVRISVLPADGSDDINIYPWQDRSVWESYINYQDSIEADKDYCYVTGEYVHLSRLSPKKIRNAGDGAKLISGNDSSSFTYRGRFSSPSEAYSIGRETTEKAHNALRWLIAKQGTRHDSQAIVAWGTKNENLPPLISDTLDILSALEPIENKAFTNEMFANELGKAIKGYKANLELKNQAVVMGVDSATPGRLSIFYYREIAAIDLINRIEKWHSSCTWKMEYRKAKIGTDEKGKDIEKYIVFYGAPSPRDIVEAAYGINAKDSFKNAVVERLLPCIIDGARIPVDIMKSAARRASNPVNMEGWEYRKTLSIACALIRKYYNDKNKNKEVFKLGLDLENNDRNYLFGRILAYMREIEAYALYQAGESRYTNAEKLQNAYCRFPAKFCNLLYKQLRPYLNRLGKKASFLEDEMMALIARIEKDAFDNTPLNETFLLGYSAQMNQFKENMKERSDKKKADSEE